MLYSEMLKNGVDETDLRKHLLTGEQVPVAFRIPESLRDAAKEAAELRGVSFSAFMRMCMIQELTKKND